MQVVDIQSFVVHGISVRTKNADEMSSALGKIGPLWGDYFARVINHVKEGGMTYGVYYHYQSDFNGEFNVLAGSDLIESLEQHGLTSVTIESGKYLVFPAKGAMPQAVIDAWTNVWNYFSAESCPHTRLYKTDFERYIGVDEVEVCIGIQ